MMHPNMAYSPANNALNDSLANLNLSPAQSADRSLAKVRYGSVFAQCSAQMSDPTNRNAASDLQSKRLSYPLPYQPCQCTMRIT